MKLRRRSLRRIAVCSCVVVMGLAGAGCEAASGPGKDVDSADVEAGVSEAASRVDAARGAPTFPELPPSVAAEDMAGKRVFRISYDDSIPYEQLVGDGVAEAGEASGVSVTQFDAKSQPAEAALGIERAVSQNYDAVIIDNYSGTQLAAPIAKAKEAGVSVVINNETSGSLPPTNPDVAGTQGFDYVRTAALQADWVIQDSKGEGVVKVFGAAGVPGSELMVKSMKDEFTELCPACQVEYEDVAVANWATQLTGLASTAITKNPELEYIIAIWDGMVFGIAPGVRNAGAADRVKIVTSNGTPAIMEMLKNGDMVAANISDPMQWLGWAAFDQAMRTVNGQEPVDHKIPSRLFDETNIGDLDIEAGVPEWYGNVYETGYLKLWGLE